VIDKLDLKYGSATDVSSKTAEILELKYGKAAKA